MTLSPLSCKQVFSDPKALEYVDGIAIHWYSDWEKDHMSTDPLDEIHDKYPEKFQLYTEACNGTLKKWVAIVKKGLVQFSTLQ